MFDLPRTYQKAELVKGSVGVVIQCFPREDLRDDTVVIRPDYIGVCRADIKEIVGSRDIPTDRGPLFGHEFVGSVIFAGNASGFKQGDLVTFNPNVTPNRTTGFAECIFVTGSEKQLDQAIVRIPETGIVNNIWMPEPLACIVHATRKLLALTGLSSMGGKRVGIIGAGCSGIMFAMYAKHLGASVMVFNRGEMRREFAVQQMLLNESEVCSLTEIDQYRDVFDIVIVVPTIVTSEILEIASDIVLSEGIIHIYGGTREGDKFLCTHVDIDTVRRGEQSKQIECQNKVLTLSGAYGCCKEDYEESFRLHAQYPDEFPLERIVSKVISFPEFPAFMMNVAAETDDYPGKVLLKTNPY